MNSTRTVHHVGVPDDVDHKLVAAGAACREVLLVATCHRGLPEPTISLLKCWGDDSIGHWYEIRRDAESVVVEYSRERADEVFRALSGDRPVRGSARPDSGSAGTALPPQTGRHSGRRSDWEGPFIPEGHIDPPF